MIGRESAAQDLIANGKVKALGNAPERSMWRYRERALAKRDLFAASLKRVFHCGFFVVVDWRWWYSLVFIVMTLHDGDEESGVESSRFDDGE